MHRLGDLIPILSGIENLLDDFAEIIILGIFVLFSAIGNALKKKAEKKEQELRESETTAVRTVAVKKPEVQRKQPRQYQQLPYAKISGKSTSQSQVSQKSSLPALGRKERPLPVAIASTLPKETVKTEGSDVPESGIPKAKPIETFVPTTPAKPAAPAKAEKQSVQTGIDIRLLRQMLKNPKQVRYLVAASEILDKPLALR